MEPRLGLLFALLQHKGVMAKRRPPAETFFGRPWKDDPKSLSVPLKPEGAVWLPVSEKHVGIIGQADAALSPTMSSAKTVSADSVPPSQPPPFSEFATFPRGMLLTYIPLLIAYIGTSGIIDDGMFKSNMYRHAAVHFVIATILVLLEAIRTIMVHKAPKLGRVWRTYLYVLPVIVCLGPLGALGNLILLHTAGNAHKIDEQDRVQQQKAQDQELQRIRQAAQAECDAARATDVESMTKRRIAAFNEHKKCLVDWVKPSIFSAQTAEQFCAAKMATFHQSAQAVKDRQNKTCNPLTTGSVK